MDCFSLLLFITFTEYPIAKVNESYIDLLKENVDIDS